MTVYPLSFSLFGLEVTGFGILMMVAFLGSGWVMQLELKRRGLNPDFSADIVVAGVVGGILGARLWYVALHGGPLLSRAGLVWYGGFLGGVAAVLAMSWWKRVPVRFTFELTAPALALGHGLGRVGCFLVQDDYGVPTTLPWAMKFPEGQPPTTAASLARWGVDVPAGTPPDAVLAVHPTQLYEVAALLFMFWLLWRLRRHRHAVGWLFGVYLGAVGLERFLVEFLRAKDDRLLGVFTLAQVTSLALLAVGVGVMILLRRADGFTVAPKDGLAPR
ncbi:MAG TPA: prolipoprotein diacylglyceryl transferase [Gemmatimonadales bacterium]